ncbi:unnamed protein product [Taenia asiatica]|uniref:Shugoshin_C domain-containing protein n=1 Tax=Taenia asiatica TaxID=60517 RepID=A0A0R3WD15_TAEAS|nr:unnamed protein product [Taenia asiatica]
MSAQQTPSVQSTKRQNRALKRGWSAKNTLNISRKILEKSVIRQNKHIESIQQNNIQLAKRVSELQKELTERTTELQVSREESFQLRLKLNRLQNNSAESALHAVCGKLASMTEEMFKVHEFAVKICSELAVPEASPFPGGTPFSLNSNDSAPMECAVTVLPDEDEEVKSSNGATPRCSAQSVEMEMDSFGPAPDSFVGYPTGRKTMAPPSSGEDVIVATPPTPFQTRKSSPAALFQNRSDSPAAAQTRKSSPPTQSISSCPDEDDEDYVPSPKAKRKRIPPVKKAKKSSRAAVAVAEITEPATSGVDPSDLPSDHQRMESNPPSAAVSATASLNKPEVNFKQGEGNEEKVEETVPPKPRNPPRRQSRRRRKRLRLIADDSVFIPISDSMMEDAISGDKENVAKAPSIPKSTPAEQKSIHVEEKVEIDKVKFTELRPVVSVSGPFVVELYYLLLSRGLIFSFPMSRSRNNGRQSCLRIDWTGTLEPGYFIGFELLSISQNVGAKGSTSQVAEANSDPPSSPIRTRRKLDPVSYVVKLNT